jgi:hypothetical protein
MSVNYYRVGSDRVGKGSRISSAVFRFRFRFLLLLLLLLPILFVESESSSTVTMYEIC